MSDASRGDNRPQSTTSFNGHPTPEQIAAWIDEPEFLPPRERQELDAHVATCPECQQVAADLRAIVAALSSLAEIEPPRSFALRRETTQEAPQPIVMTETRVWRERQLRATRWATAIAAILLVLVLSVDLFSGNGGTSRSSSEATTMQMKSAPMSAAGADSNESTSSAGSAAQEQERTTGGAAADTSGDTATPADSSEAFGFGSAATPASDSAAGAAPAPENATTDASGAVAATPDASTLTTAQETISQGAEEPEPSGNSRLQLVETGLAMLIVWLLIAMVAIPHLRRQSGNPR